MKTLALDFDGVVCHSAVEIGHVAWQCASEFWPTEFQQKDIPQTILDGFLQVRPFLEVGAEAILMVRLLQNGWTPSRFASEFCGRSDQLMKEAGVSRKELVASFGGRRDRLIREDAASWLALNPCYPDSLKAMEILKAQGVRMVIITTKQARFAEVILRHQGMDFDMEDIVGMEAGCPKAETLARLAAEPSVESLSFVEDRLQTLRGVERAGAPLERVRLFLASWGYVTAQDVAEAADGRIRVIDSLMDII